VTARVAFVVLAYGPPARTDGLVELLRGAGAHPEQILVVHNGGPGGDAPLTDQEVEVLRQASNRGYAGGMNAGARHAVRGEPELLVLLTQDARFADGALDLLLDAARRHPEYGLLGPELHDVHRGVPFSYGVRVGPTGGPRHVLKAPAAEDGILACDSLDGAFLVVRPQVLTDVGGFDERYFMYYEEADLMLRARRHGWRVGVVAGARGEQQIGGPARPGPYAYLRVRNGIEFSRRAAGPLGLAGGLARAMRDLIMWGRRPFRPGRSPAGRRAAIASVRAGLRGLFDFARRRFGPPPPDLPGMGDVRL
jgi:GT2 family glycosyltransferase